jgi:hypothetical protein
MNTPPTRTNNRVGGARCHGEEGRVHGVWYLGANQPHLVRQSTHLVRQDCCCGLTHNGDAISFELEEEEDDYDEKMKTPPATRTNDRVGGARCHGEEGSVHGVWYTGVVAAMVVLQQMMLESQGESSHGHKVCSSRNF